MKIFEASHTHNVIDQKIPRELSDCKIVVNGQTFYCHREILNRSRLFYEMSQDELIKNLEDGKFTLTIQNSDTVTPKRAAKYLPYLYTAEFTTSDSLLEEIETCNHFQSTADIKRIENSIASDTLRQSMISEIRSVWLSRDNTTPVARSQLAVIRQDDPTLYTLLMRQREIQHLAQQNFKNKSSQSQIFKFTLDCLAYEVMTFLRVLKNGQKLYREKGVHNNFYFGYQKGEILPFIQSMEQAWKSRPDKLLQP